MVSFTVRMKFLAEDRAEVDEMLRALTPASRAEAGCVTYIPHWVEGEPATVLIYEQYVDDAAVEAHGKTEHFQKYAVGGLYQKMKERAKEVLTAVC